MNKAFFIEIEEGTKLKAICGAIVTCKEDGSDVNVNMVNIREKDFDAGLIGLTICDGTATAVITMGGVE